MQLSLSRLRLPRPSLEWLPVPNRAVLLYALYTLVLFLVFLVANFPHQALVDRALSAVDVSPLRFGIQETRFAWWKGYEFRGVRLSQATPGGDVLPLFESQSLFVRPGLKGLVRGQLSSGQIEGQLYGGEVEGSWLILDNKARANVRLNGLQIARYALLARVLEQGSVDGRLSGSVTIEPRGTDLRAGQAAAELKLNGAGTSGVQVQGFIVPDLTGCTGGARLALRSGRLEIEELQAACQEAKFSGSGQVVLRDRFADSVLNLRVVPEEGPAPTDAWKTLIQLVPKSITGTVARPRFQLAEGGPAGEGKRRRAR